MCGSAEMLILFFYPSCTEAPKALLGKKNTSMSIRYFYIFVAIFANVQQYKKKIRTQNSSFFVVVFNTPSPLCSEKKIYIRYIFDRSRASEAYDNDFSCYLLSLACYIITTRR